MTSERLTTSDGNTLVYDRLPGGAPGVVFLHGLKSDRGGTKALALEIHCAQRGYAFVRFDMYGHGESSGTFEDGGPSRWRDDATAIIDTVTEGPQILIGSSMGGWVMTLAALARPVHVAGLIGIAPAPDFTDEMMAAELDDTQRAQLNRDGHVDLPSDYGDEPMRISRHLIADGGRHLILTKPIPLYCDRLLAIYF